MLTFVRQPPPPTRPTTALTPPGAAPAHGVRPWPTDLDRLTSTRALDARQTRPLVSGSAMRHTLAPRLSQTWPARLLHALEIGFAESNASALWSGRNGPCVAVSTPPCHYLSVRQIAFGDAWPCAALSPEMIRLRMPPHSNC